MKCAGLIIDNSPHYLDHLAPFCGSLSWPLIVCEESIAEQCRRFYPTVEILETEFSKLQLPPCIVSCDNRTMLDSLLGPLHPWRGRLLWLPHGLSDKGWKRPFFEALEREDVLLVYGQRMREILRAKNIKLPQISVGNFRFNFYRANREFYDHLLQKHFGNQRFILYAPTWEDSEDNGTFWEAFPRLLDAVPSHLHLLIKPHPNTEQRFGAKLERCRALAEAKANVIFLDEFLPIYPLLSRTEVYIGDMSSIGYDALFSEKPLFFLQREKTNSFTDPSSFLMRCGKQILLEEIPELFHQPFSVAQKSKEITTHSFDEVAIEQIAEAIQRYLE